MFDAGGGGVGGEGEGGGILQDLADEEHVPLFLLEACPWGRKCAPPTLV